MAEIQTIDEMRAALDGEWVLIVDCEYEDHVLVRGRVAAHSPKRADIYQEMGNYRSGAIRNFGKIAEDVILML